MRYTKLLIISCVCICLLLGSCQKAKETKEQAIELTVAQGLLEDMEKSRPQEVFVYPLRPGDPRQLIDKYMRSVSLKGPVEETQDLYKAKINDRYIEIRKISNAVFYGDMNVLWTEKPTPEKASWDGPDDQKAERIALDWLGQFGFSEKDIASLEVTVSDEAFELTSPQGEKIPARVVVGKNVEVRRRIDGLLVYGPGSKIKLFVGPKGEIRGFLAAWPSLAVEEQPGVQKPEAVQEKAIKTKPISIKTAFELLKKNPLDHLPLALVRKIDIDKIAFGYYGRSASEAQKYLQPVYVFSGTAMATLPEGREVQVPYVQYIVALEKALEPIWPEGKQWELTPRTKSTMAVAEKDVDEKGGQETEIK
jgi:hypothetical protein